MTGEQTATVDMRVMRAVERGQSIHALQKAGYNVAQIVGSIERLLQLGLMQVTSDRVELSERGALLLKSFATGPDGGSKAWIAPLADRRTSRIALDAPYVPGPRSLQELLRGIEEGRYGRRRNMES